MKRTLSKLSKNKFGELVVGIAFGKFSKALPVKRIKETKKAIAFWHPKPSYHIHILVVPKKQIKNFSSIKETDFKYTLEVFKLANEIISDMRLKDTNYSLVINGGDKQEVKQLHLHIISDIK